MPAKSALKRIRVYFVKQNVVQRAMLVVHFSTTGSPTVSHPASRSTVLFSRQEWWFVELPRKSISESSFARHVLPLREPAGKWVQKIQLCSVFGLNDQSPVISFVLGCKLALHSDTIPLNLLLQPDDVPKHGCLAAESKPDSLVPFRRRWESHSTAAYFGGRTI